MPWIWDYISIYGPCLSWELCDVCDYTTVAYWKKGKKAGFATVCQDCGERNYTITVFATAN